MVALPAFALGLILDVTTIRFEAPWPLGSPSRGLFEPVISGRELFAGAASEGELLVACLSLAAGLVDSCFLFVEAAALSRIF